MLILKEKSATIIENDPYTGSVKPIAKHSAKKKTDKRRAET